MRAASARRAQLAATLAHVRERVADAEATAGRPAGSVTLIGVTKTFPASDVAHLADLGLRDVGENRDQEARTKVEAVRALTSSPIAWHFIGQLQRNKVASVCRYADLVHTVDRLTLVTALARAATLHRSEPLGVLIQVSLDAVGADGADHADGADGRGGVAPEGVPELADAIRRAEGLLLRGVMGVAPLGGEASRAFNRLHEVADDLRSTDPHADVLSAGMTADFEEAIRHGATHVRVGSALMGARTLVAGSLPRNRNDSRVIPP